MSFAKVSKTLAASILLLSCFSSIYDASAAKQSGTHYFDDGQVGNNLTDPGNLLFTQDSKNGISGMSWSKLYPDKVWMHDDRYRNQKVFYRARPYFMELMLVNPANNQIANVFRINVVSEHLNNLNWEDMATGPSNDPARNYLYIGDIGDNSRNKSTRNIYRLLEPTLAQSYPTVSIPQPVENISFVYPTIGSEDTKIDSEAMIVDPVSNDIFILQKRRKVETGSHYRQRRVFVLRKSVYEAAIANRTTMTAELVGCMFHPWPSTGEPSLKQITGANISPDGREVLVRTYNEVFYYQKKANESIESLLIGSNTACDQEAITYDGKLQFVNNDIAGESITQLYDQSKYLTVSEINSSQGATNKMFTYMRNNQKPIANTDQAVTPRNVSVIIDAKANDINPEGTATVITGVSDPAHGTAVIQNGQILYTPDNGYTGTDTFEYYLKDQFSASPMRAYYVKGVVSVTVQ